MRLLVFCGILAVYVGDIRCLECRVCSRAVSLNDCTETRICQPNEECYMEEIITASSKIAYVGGCRSTAVCSAALGGKRRRQTGGDLVACSRCCDTPEITSATIGKHFCNDNLCGLRGQSTVNGTQLSECYECSDVTVSQVDTCDRITTCQSDQVCGVWANYHSGSLRYYMGCQPKTILIESSVPIGKRDTRVCNVCCGDALCNTGLCHPLLEKLKTLYSGGNLDINTLTYIQP